MFGSRGPMVAKLQGWLNELLKLRPPLNVNGFFDQKTAAAVRRFQQQNKISVNLNPVVGFNTWKEIGKKLGQTRIFADSDLSRELKKIMAPDVIASPGNMRIDKVVFRFLFRLRFPKKIVDKLDDDNLDRLLGFMEADTDVNDLRWFAYMLATVLLECGPDFLPKAEGGCNDTTGCSPISQVINGVRKVNNRDYGRPMACPNTRLRPPRPCPSGNKTHTYYGRGYVQLTRDSNYQSMSQRLGRGEELIHFPERVMQPDLAYTIMSVGMREGSFTRHKLSDFISGTKCDYRSARLIINPADTSTFDTGRNFATIFEGILEASVIQ